MSCIPFSSLQETGQGRHTMRKVCWQSLLWSVLIFLNPAPATTREAPQPPQVPVSADQPEAQASVSADEQQQTPVFRSEINFVRVDAIVTDNDGNPVLDLTADDFEIFEDDVAQQIESFRLVQITGLPDPDLPPPSSIRNEFDEEREAAREDSRIFVFFLDDYHVRYGNAVRMTAPLVEFVETQLAPTDLVAVMYPLTPVGDVRLTRDHAQIVRALQSFEGRKYNYEPKNLYEQQYTHYDTTTVEMIRNDVSLSALKALSIHLGGLREGRKSAIVLTEGYSNYVPPQMRHNAQAVGTYNPQRNNPLAGENPFEETNQFFEASAMRMILLDAADVANKNNTSLYMVDPRGLAAGEFDMSNPVIDMRTDRRIMRDMQDTLYVLADQTDGRAIMNRNDVQPGLAQIVADQSSYYLLGYTSSGAPTDGKFHEIKVRVRRDDINVRARKGYYALTETNAARVLAPPRRERPRAIDIALASLAEPTNRRLVRTWVGASRGNNGRTKMTFVWEPVGASRDQRRESASQVMLMAMNDSSAYFRGEVPARSGGNLPRADFEADPGSLELNVAIEDEYGDVLDRAVDQWTVPDFTGPDVALSTPTVLRAQNALELRQFLSDPEALPSASRHFRRTDHLLVRVEVYTPGDTAAVVTGQLLNREGLSMLELPIEQLAGTGTHQLNLQLAPFPRGDYLVEISAEAGDQVATSLVAFRIQG
ncbi:MAG: hypothetical protein CL484_06550 [Acidobacteria bacterium]|nr:hypothetical protein [Acidobacteriota bacterium]